MNMRLSNKQIFFHAGFHKTVLTFFQKKIYINETNINFLNRSSIDNKKISKLINTDLKNYGYE